MRLLLGRSTPAIRAMQLISSFYLPSRQIYQPCRCLCRGFVQMTRTTPLRRITLQLSHIFLTEGRTFICSLPAPGRSDYANRGASYTVGLQRTQARFPSIQRYYDGLFLLFGGKRSCSPQSAFFW